MCIRDRDYDYQEFNVIVDTIYNLSHRLRKSMRQVKLERIKIDEILKQMNEGLSLIHILYIKEGVKYGKEDDIYYCK